MPADTSTSVTGSAVHLTDSRKLFDHVAQHRVWSGHAAYSGRSTRAQV